MRSRFVSLCLGLALWCGTAAAATLEIPLPGLVGSYPAGASRTITLDLGGPVDSILRVSIRWSGTATAGLAHGDGVERPLAEYFPYHGSFLVVLNEGSGISAYGSCSPDSGAWADTSAVKPWLKTPWSFLQDGTCTLRCEFNPDLSWGFVVVSLPSATIGQATAVIEWTSAVPAERESWGAVKSRYR
jgi:hypothetical protein